MSISKSGYFNDLFALNFKYIAAFSLVMAGSNGLFRGNEASKANPAFYVLLAIGLLYLFTTASPSLKKENYVNGFVEIFLGESLGGALFDFMNSEKSSGYVGLKLVFGTYLFVVFVRLVILLKVKIEEHIKVRNSTRIDIVSLLRKRASSSK